MIGNTFISMNDLLTRPTISDAVWISTFQMISNTFWAWVTISKISIYMIPQLVTSRSRFIRYHLTRKYLRYQVEILNYSRIV